jgi:hypothetical protein
MIQNLLTKANKHIASTASLLTVYAFLQNYKDSKDVQNPCQESTRKAIELEQQLSKVEAMSESAKVETAAQTCRVSEYINQIKHDVNQVLITDQKIAVTDSPELIESLNRYKFIKGEAIINNVDKANDVLSEILKGKPGSGSSSSVSNFVQNLDDFRN